MVSSIRGVSESSGWLRLIHDTPDEGVSSERRYKRAGLSRDAEAATLTAVVGNVFDELSLADTQDSRCPPGRGMGATGWDWPEPGRKKRIYRRGAEHAE
jgi:hypothetical protein